MVLDGARDGVVLGVKPGFKIRRKVWDTGSTLSPLFTCFLPAASASAGLHLATSKQPQTTANTTAASMVVVLAVVLVNYVDKYPPTPLLPKITNWLADNLIGNSHNLAKNCAAWPVT